MLAHAEPARAELARAELAECKQFHHFEILKCRKDSDIDHTSKQRKLKKS